MPVEVGHTYYIARSSTFFNISASFNLCTTHQAQLIKEMLVQDPSRRPSAEQISKSVSLKSLTRQLKKKKDALVPVM